MPSGHPSSAPWAVRGGLQVLGLVAPPAAAAVALHLFARPPRPGSVTVHPARPGHELVVTVRGADVHGWRWGEGPSVFLVHGWGGNAGHLASFVEPLVTAGLGVLAFDAPAHGRSRGDTSSLPAFADTIAAFAGLAGAPRGIIAHSFGAAASTLALRRGLPLAAEGFRAVFVAPFIDPARYFDLFVRSLGLSARLLSSMRARAEKRFGVRWDEIDVLAHAPRMLAPLLVVHDRDDRRLPLRDAEALVGAWPAARLHTTRGLGHNRILSDAAVVREAVSFVAASSATGDAASAYD